MLSSFAAPTSDAATLGSGHLAQRYRGVVSAGAQSLTPEIDLSTASGKCATIKAGLKESTKRILHLRSQGLSLNRSNEDMMRKQFSVLNLYCPSPHNSTQRTAQKKTGALRQGSCLVSQKPDPEVTDTTLSVPKTVHFDQDLERVCFFLKADQPSMVATYPCFVTDKPSVHKVRAETPITQEAEWNISTPKFPCRNPTRNDMPVRVQRVFFSSHRNVLVIFVVVADLAYEKRVVCRYTRDYWKTISETPGQYYRTSSHGGGKKNDKFVIIITLPREDDLGSDPFFFCVRYSVAMEEFWDNNSGMNFEVDFHR